MWENDTRKYKTAAEEGSRALMRLRDAVGHVEVLTDTLMAPDQSGKMLAALRQFTEQVETLTNQATKNAQLAAKAAQDTKKNAKGTQQGLIRGRVSTNIVHPNLGGVV